MPISHRMWVLSRDGTLRHLGRVESWHKIIAHAVTHPQTTAYLHCSDSVSHISLCALLLSSPHILCCTMWFMFRWIRGQAKVAHIHTSNGIYVFAYVKPQPCFVSKRQIVYDDKTSNEFSHSIKSCRRQSVEKLEWILRFHLLQPQQDDCPIRFFSIQCDMECGFVANQRVLHSQSNSV